MTDYNVFPLSCNVFWLSDSRFSSNFLILTVFIALFGRENWQYRHIFSSIYPRSPTVVLCVETGSDAVGGRIH